MKGMIYISCLGVKGNATVTTIVCLLSLVYAESNSSVIQSMVTTNNLGRCRRIVISNVEYVLARGKYVDLSICLKK